MLDNPVMLCKCGCLDKRHEDPISPKGEKYCFDCPCDNFIPCLRPDTCGKELVNGELNCKLCWERY